MKLQNKYLLLVLTLLSVSGCSDPEQSGAEQVLIELHASGDGVVTTKADQTITQAFATTVFASLRDGDYTALASPASTYEWKKETEVQTTGAVSLPGTPVYPEDGSWIHLIAVSPNPASYNSSAGTVAYTLTGQTDLMYAPQIKANRWDGLRFSNNTNQAVTPLNYAHQLTQLKFKAKKEYAGGLTVKVKSITVKAVTTQATVTLHSGETAFSGSSNLSLTMASGGTDISTVDATDLGGLFLPPLSSGNSYKITVDTSIGEFKDLSIDFSGSQNLFAKGYSHAITLLISDTGVGISSVTVASWTSGSDKELDLTD